jgi:hypothetical protein
VELDYRTAVKTRRIIEFFVFVRYGLAEGRKKTTLLYWLILGNRLKTAVKTRGIRESGA